MTILELIELIKAFEETFDVKASPDWEALKEYLI